MATGSPRPSVPLVRAIISLISCAPMGESQQTHRAAAPQPPETLMLLIDGSLPTSIASRIRVLNGSARVLVRM